MPSWLASLQVFPACFMEMQLADGSKAWISQGYCATPELRAATYISVPNDPNCCELGIGSTRGERGTTEASGPAWPQCHRCRRLQPSPPPTAVSAAAPAPQRSRVAGPSTITIRIVIASIAAERTSTSAWQRARRRSARPHRLQGRKYCKCPAPSCPTPGLSSRTAAPPPCKAMRSSRQAWSTGLRPRPPAHERCSLPELSAAHGGHRCKAAASVRRCA